MAKYQQTWWENNLATKMSTFRHWIGDHNAVSKVFCRKLVVEAGYKSILDCGCGVCTEYDGYKKDGYEIAYQGMDATPLLVKLAQDRGIDCIQGYLEEMPVPDKSVDVVYIRHVLEHLQHYGDAINEAMRVAKKEVMVVFFIRPGPGGDAINHNPNGNLFHNKYGQPGIEATVRAHPRFASFEWKDITKSENVLRIRVKE